MDELALFAGAGGGILGGLLLGWRTVCAVEINSFARRVLLARQADGCLEPFPIWDDITTFDGNPWRGRIDVVSGGFPCQDISAPGRGAGLDGERSGLWAEMARIIGEVQPAFVWVENSPMLVVRGLKRVLWDLAALGYDARWGIISAADAGAPHLRERCWICAYANSGGSERSTTSAEQILRSSALVDGQCWRVDRSKLHGVSDGLANRVDRLGAIGNGQVPACVALAWKILNSENDG